MKENRECNANWGFILVHKNYLQRCMIISCFVVGMYRVAEERW